MTRAAVFRRLAITLAFSLPLLATVIALPAPAGAHRARWGARGPLPPLGHEGRWLTDAAGRVVMLHGVNQVSKAPPFHPSAFGFGADDAAFLAEQGFNAVRLGIAFEGLMPEPGRVDEAYIDALATSVRQLARRRIFVLLDFHQDGYGPKYRGNGLPEWMSLDDGLPNPPVGFPDYYVLNPALQRAFDNLWLNRAGPDGVELQDAYAQGVGAVARRFARNPWVFGYDVMNEPWPGANWVICSSGCPDLERERLVPFYARAREAVREHSRRQQVYVEPFVLFNFGFATTSLPGPGSDQALSVHSYADVLEGEQGVLDNAVAAAERDGAALLVTEFGATIDPVPLSRLTAGFDRNLVPWMMWAYNESIIADAGRPAGLDNLRSLEALAALVRPYPMAVAGTPTRIHFDPESRVFELVYDTAGPSGRRSRRWLPTVVFVPELHYPDGYRAKVRGARVISRPCARRLLLRRKPRAREVVLRLIPGGRCRR